MVNIGETPKLPTIQEFFTEMAERQHDEIRKLKAEIAGRPLSGEVNPHPEDPRKPVPDPWILHPVRIKPAKKKTPKKRAVKKSTARKSAAKKSKRLSAKTSRRKPSGKKSARKRR